MRYCTMRDAKGNADGESVKSRREGEIIDHQEDGEKDGRGEREKSKPLLETAIACDTD